MVTLRHTKPPAHPSEPLVQMRRESLICALKPFLYFLQYDLLRHASSHKLDNLLHAMSSLLEIVLCFGDTLRTHLCTRRVLARQ